MRSAKPQTAQRKRVSRPIGPPLGVPRLVLADAEPPARRNGQPKAADTVYYEGADHGEVPHVVKFSGGRSSGMLLFMLLENGLLQAERGDVVIFNNTSAEHRKTYEFTRRCKGLVEDHYGIPFFWLEFQTYEDARSGEWSRLPTYRLVRSEPRSAKVCDGYCWRGEVFEEMLSWTGYVPNQFSRICTKALKLETTRRFLRDWFSGKEGIPRQGHHGRESRMTDSAIFERHTRNRGGVPRDILLGKKRYLREQRVHRPAQRFADYSPAFRLFDNPTLAGGHCNGNTLPDADDGPEYVAFIGLRGDEMHRVVRVKGRNSGSEPVSGNEGEHIYAPLAEIGIDREAVDGFWDRQSWGLNWERGTSLSNCVYCFLKGTGNLRRVHAAVDKRLAPKYQNTPSDIGWWVNMEKVYGRNLKAENRRPPGSPPKFIGFFGSNGLTYERLLAKDACAGGPPGPDDGSLPCDCTD